MTRIPQPTEVCAAQTWALQALAPTANLERSGPKPPERAQRPAHGWPGRVDMAVRPLPAARAFVPLSNVAIPLDAIPAMTGVAR